MPLLTLNSGRVVAYAQDGEPRSNRVLLFFVGIFVVGSIKHSYPVVKDQGLYHVVVTLPGWGDASPVPPSSTFAKTLIGDITALFDHLYADTSNLKIRVAGASFGSVPTQVIYGASFDVFPLGRNVAGMMLLAPFCPPSASTRTTLNPSAGTTGSASALSPNISPFQASAPSL